MAEQATYNLYVDWNNDGYFDGPGEDCSIDFVSATISRGFSSPLARVATVGRATLLLNNINRQYSPALQADVRPGRPVQLDMTYNAITETLFAGEIENIVPASGQYESRRVTIQCVDAMALLDRYEGEIALQTEAYADDIISAVVSACYTPPATDYENGINYFPTSGARWSWEGSGYPAEHISGARKIQDVAAADWGHFFISRAAVPTYHNRHHMPLDISTELTLAGSMLALGYQKSISEIYNYVAIKCSPRVVGETNEVLGRLSQDDAPRVPAGGSAIFLIEFRDSAASAKRIGGKDGITPVAGTDFNCTDDPGGEGTNVNADITPTATWYADKAEVTLANAGANPAYVQALQVRGIAVRTREPCTMIAQDATSIAAYQKRNLQLNVPVMSWQGDAQNLADWLLDYYKDPADVVRGVQFGANVNPTLMAAARDLELLDKVEISETQTGLSSYEGFIYSMRVDIGGGGDVHRVTMDLETAYDYGADPFIVDSSRVDGPDVIFY